MGWELVHFQLCHSSALFDCTLALNSTWGNKDALRICTTIAAAYYTDCIVMCAVLLSRRLIAMPVIGITQVEKW
jgi:hypothetical protein